MPRLLALCAAPARNGPERSEPRVEGYFLLVRCLSKPGLSKKCVLQIPPHEPCVLIASFGGNQDDNTRETAGKAATARKQFGQSGCCCRQSTLATNGAREEHTSRASELSLSGSRHAAQGVPKRLICDRSIPTEGKSALTPTLLAALQHSVCAHTRSLQG